MNSNQRAMSPRILVIDDNSAIHDDFRKILANSAKPGDTLHDMRSALFGSPSQTTPTVAFEVDCAFQGNEGVEKVRQAQSIGQPYALAFVDSRMPPGWDGIETISHLWLACPDLQVVLCTAYTDYSWQDIQRKLGGAMAYFSLKNLSTIWKCSNWPTHLPVNGN